MNISFDAVAFGLGCAGAFGHESLRWIGLRTDARLPIYLRKYHYWLLTLMLILLGGALASLLGPTSAVQALCFGIAAPSILTRIGTLAPSDETLGPEMGSANREVAHTSLRDFLRG